MTHDGALTPSHVHFDRAQRGTLANLNEVASISPAVARNELPWVKVPKNHPPPAAGGGKRGWVQSEFPGS